VLSEGLGEATGGEDECGGAGGDDGEAERYREHALRCVAGSHELGWTVGGLSGDEEVEGRRAFQDELALLDHPDRLSLDPPC